MKISGKMCFKIILKVHKKTGVHPLFRRYIFQKITGEVRLTSHDSNNNNSNNNVDDLTNLGDGSLYHIFRCGSKRCQFQNKFIPVNNILSTTTNRLYKYIAAADSTYVNDRPSNMVYLITCNKCKLQYVGKTSQNLNKTFNWYNSCFRNTTAYSFCKILNTHFSKGYCN